MVKTILKIRRTPGYGASGVSQSLSDSDLRFEYIDDNTIIVYAPLERVEKALEAWKPPKNNAGGIATRITLEEETE